MTEPDPAEWTVLFLCTGNICRSPMADRLAATRLAQWFGTTPDGLTATTGLRVVSAGTHAWQGSPMQPGSERTLLARGIDPGPFRARELSEGLVAYSDLVLGLTRAHRAAAVTLHPPANRRTFTLRQFARLAATVSPAALPPGPPPARAAALVSAVALARGVVPAVPGDEEDVLDPLGEADDGFARCYDLIADSLGWLDLLAAPLPG